MKKIIRLTENDLTKLIKRVVFEQKKSRILKEIDSSKAIDFLKQLAGKNQSNNYDTTSTSSNTSTSSDTETSSSSGQKVSAGKYFTHPNVDSINIKYRASAIPLNKDAERLLKSIFAEAGTTNLEVTSTLRTYEDQARANSQNSRANIVGWYGNDVAQAWDRLKAKQITQQEFANYLKDRDSKRGKLMSNHLSGFAIDIVPYSDQFASTAEKLMKQGGSGIKKVLREKSNNAVHIEFDFSVTDKAGLSSPFQSTPSKRQERTADKAIIKSGIIIDRRNNSSNYSLVYGGTPSTNYGAKFMYEIGKNYLNKNVIYANNEITIPQIEQELATIDPNGKIVSVSGFSGGGPKTLAALNSGKYKFIGFIDPYINSPITNLPSNAKMISRADNWSPSKYPQVKSALKQMENMGTSELIASNTYNHDSMPEYFFQKYGEMM
jgi:hypothetical protein